MKTKTSYVFEVLLWAGLKGNANSRGYIILRHTYVRPSHGLTTSNAVAGYQPKLPHEEKITFATKSPLIAFGLCGPRGVGEGVRSY